jgi:hypothetical protein
MERRQLRRRGAREAQAARRRQNASSADRHTQEHNEKAT